MQLSEYEAFQRLISGLDLAIDGANSMRPHRLDQDWKQVAELLTAMREKIYQLGEGRTQ